jgi:hypothetical protein
MPSGKFVSPATASGSVSGVKTRNKAKSREMTRTEKNNLFLGLFCFRVLGFRFVPMAAKV